MTADLMEVGLTLLVGGCAGFISGRYFDRSVHGNRWLSKVGYTPTGSIRSTTTPSEPHYSGLTSSQNEEKDRILALYQDLASKHSLNDAEQQEFDRLDGLLATFEREETEEFNRGFASSRAGKLNAALDRLETSVQAMTSETKK